MSQRIPPARKGDRNEESSSTVSNTHTQTTDESTPSTVFEGPLQEGVANLVGMEEDIVAELTQNTPSAARPLIRRSTSSALRERQQAHLSAARPVEACGPPVPTFREVQQREQRLQEELATLQEQTRTNDSRHSRELEQVAFTLRRIEEQQKIQMSVQTQLMNALVGMDLQARETVATAAATQSRAAGDENVDPLSPRSGSPAADKGFQLPEATETVRATASSQPQPSLADDTDQDKSRKDSVARSSVSSQPRKVSRLGSINEVVNANVKTSPGASSSATKIFAAGTVFRGREELDECLKREGLKSEVDAVGEMVV